MKHQVLTLGLASAALLLGGCRHGEPQLRTHADTLSWALGQNTAQSLQQGPLTDIDRDLFLQAVAHTLDGKPQPLSEEQYQQALASIIGAAQQPQADGNQRAADAAQEEYFAQLVESDPTVQRHPSGFYYKVLTPGHGPNAQYAQRISFHYRSFLMLSGEPYDQTYGKREPIIHVVGKPMFPGLIDAFQLMNPGSKYRFYFPYQLAFGAQGSGSIPPYTPFIYEIELIQTFDN
ncbi:MAG: FKBP-type peptidyl-prolyl cis-trans isomerase [Bacteroidales bacterium]|nr:FKBP-type peptidyl-prolyl cis-trans isomerase [Bacteroidales bacterium]